MLVDGQLAQAIIAHSKEVEPGFGAIVDPSNYESIIGRLIDQGKISMADLQEARKQEEFDDAETEEDTADQVKIEVEYQDAEGIVMIVQDGHAFGFDEFDGRWQRVGGPTATSTSGGGDTSPALADANNRLRSFEQKRTRIEPLLEKALAERDELVAKLRDAGVKSPADLKGNLRGQQLAGSVQRISAEIEGLERQIVTIDAALLDAKAVIRRMDREQAGISVEEMRKLAEQLKDAEERTDGTPLPVTPLDVDSAVEKALKGSAGQATPKNSK